MPHFCQTPLGAVSTLYDSCANRDPNLRKSLSQEKAVGMEEDLPKYDIPTMGTGT